MIKPPTFINLSTADDASRRQYINDARAWLHDFRVDVMPMLKAAHNNGEGAARDTWLYINDRVSEMLRRSAEAVQRTIKVDDSEYTCWMLKDAMQELEKYNKLFEQYR